jgi:hypothetical protein
MLQDVIWIRVLIKSIIDVTLNHNFIIERLLTEKTWEECVVAVTIAGQSLVTRCFVIAILSEHEHHEHRE